METIKYDPKPKRVEFVGPRAGVLNPPDMGADTGTNPRPVAKVESFSSQHVPGEMPVYPQIRKSAGRGNWFKSERTG